MREKIVKTKRAKREKFFTTASEQSVHVVLVHKTVEPKVKKTNVTLASNYFLFFRFIYP